MVDFLCKEKEKKDMALVFSKEKMLKRLEAEGRLGEIEERSREIMDRIDGLEAEKNRFKALVYDEIEYYVRHPEIGNVPVNINDCEEKRN